LDYVTKKHHPYLRYQEMTSRRIPIVVFQRIDAAIDSMVNKGPFVSVLVIGEDVFQSGFSISQAARKEGLVLWTAQPI